MNGKYKKRICAVCRKEFPVFLKNRSAGNRSSKIYRGWNCKTCSKECARVWERNKYGRKRAYKETCANSNSQQRSLKDRTAGVPEGAESLPVHVDSPRGKEGNHE